jgi:hypothetical protein
MSWVEDRLEILNLIASYSHAADGLDPEAYGACFTVDGVFHGRVGMPDEMKVTGRDKLVKWHARAIAQRGEVQNRHIQTNTMVVEQTETRALVRTYLLVMVTRAGGAPTPGLTSVYEDEIVKTDEGWRIAVRRALPDRGGVLREAAGAPAEQAGAAKP